jgi:hypothetical protein
MQQAAWQAPSWLRNADPTLSYALRSHIAGSVRTTDPAGSLETVAEVRAEETPVATPTPEPWATMEVRRGDTLFDLALWFGVKPGDIAAFNGIDVGDHIVIGETLALPVPESEFVLPPEPVAYVAAEDVVAAPEPVIEPEPEPTVAPPPAFTGTTDEVIAAICSLPWPCEQMVRVAMCESGLWPLSHNPAGYFGLFQINFEFDGWSDPWVNAQVAYELKYLPALQGGGTGLEPWPVCGYY